MIKQEIQDYYLWNTKKIQTAVSKPKNVKCGYIYWTKIGKNIGCEVFGKNANFTRPVLVLKRIDLQKSLFLGIPLSSKLKNNPYSYIFKDSKGRFQNALLDQIRIFDTRRILSRCANIDKTELKNISSKISVYILAE